jgi:hypothetical protein
MLNNEASAASVFTLSNIATATSTVTGSAVDMRDGALAFGRKQAV